MAAALAAPITEMTIGQSLLASFATAAVTQGLSGVIAGKPKSPELPGQAATPELPAPSSGGVDTVAAANKRRQATSRLKGKSGPESTVLSSVGAGGSLGAG